MFSHPIISPAYYFEELAFNPNYQLENDLQKNVLARVIAVAAPILYVYQIGLHLVLAALEVVTCLITLTDGKQSKNGFSSALYSVRSLGSAILEIPHKLINGPSDAPNYCGNEDRYEMLDHRWANQIVWS